MLKRYKAAAKAAGIRGVRFHDLRNTFGTRMAAAGAPMRTLQEWMGHRDYKTTLIYADYAPIAHERELVERAFGGQGATIRVATDAAKRTEGDDDGERQRDYDHDPGRAS